MDEIYLVYKTDVHHSYASRDIIGVATDFSYALEICRLQSKKESEEISEEQFWNLQNLKQTQGYSGEGEFVIEPVSTNVLL
jgi:hypothetical protein